MANIFDNVANGVFKLLKQSGRKVVLYDVHGRQIYDVAEARKFYSQNDGLMVTIEDDNNDSSLSVMYGNNIDTKEVSRLLNNLRTLASRYNLLFNVNRYGKRLSPKDFAYKSVPLAENSGTPRMFKIIQLANNAQKAALRENLKQTYVEGIDFSFYGSSVVVRESFKSAKAFLKESFGVLINESPENKLIQYALAWFNARTKAAGGEPLTATSKQVVDLAEGLAEIVSKRLKLNINPNNIPKFTSHVTETIFKIDLALAPNAGINKDSLWVYYSSIVDKLQNGNKIDKNEEFFVKRLVDLVDLKLGMLNESLGFDDVDLTELARKNLMDIRQECSERGIVLSDTVNSYEEFSALLVGLICQRVSADISTLLTDHFEDFIGMVREVFPDVSYVPNMLPEMESLTSWINEGQQVSDIEIAKFAARNFDVNHFFKEYGTEFWVGADPFETGKKRRHPSQVIPAIVSYIREEYGIRDVSVANTVATVLFNKIVKNALERDHDYVFEGRLMENDNKIIEHAKEFIEDMIASGKGVLANVDHDWFYDEGELESELILDLASDVIGAAMADVDKHFDSRGIASDAIKDDKEILEFTKNAIIKKYELNDMLSEAADSFFQNDELYLNKRSTDWAVEDQDERGRFFSYEKDAREALSKNGYVQTKAFDPKHFVFKKQVAECDEVIPADVGKSFKKDIKSPLFTTRYEEDEE